MSGAPEREREERELTEEIAYVIANAASWKYGGQGSVEWRVAERIVRLLRASEARESGSLAYQQRVRGRTSLIAGADVESERIEGAVTDVRRALVLDRLYRAAERDATELADDYETIAAAYQEASLEAQEWRSAALQARADLIAAPADLGLPADTKWVEWSSEANTIRMIDRLEAIHRGVPKTEGEPS